MNEDAPKARFTYILLDDWHNVWHSKWTFMNVWEAATKTDSSPIAAIVEEYMIGTLAVPWRFSTVCRLDDLRHSDGYAISVDSRAASAIQRQDFKLGGEGEDGGEGDF